MQQEMKANLLIHIETNRSFIEEKVYDEFKIECLKEYELKDIDVNKMIGIMQQVFDFGDENPFMKKFFARAQDSIERYIVERYSSAHETENVTLDINMLLDVIFACVEYGFEKQQQQPRVFNEEVPEEIKIEVPQKQQPPSRQKKEPKKQQQPVVVQKVKKFYVPKPKTPEKKNFIERFEMPETKVPARYLMHMAKQVKKQKQQPAVPQVTPEQLDFIARNKQSIRKRLRDLYEHYCAQQQNLGKCTTFDRIKDQCRRMTVGKFLIFCKNVKLFDEQLITKEFILGRFKKISDGRKQIQFNKFEELLRSIDNQYIQLKRKQNSDDSKMPSFEARLLLQGMQYKKLKKQVELAFSTREKQGRQLKAYSTLQTRRYDKKEELTPHSGRFPRDLREDLQRKLNSQTASHKKQKSQAKPSPNPKMISLSNIDGQGLPGLEWLIQEANEDRTFLREYRSRDVVQEMKKRVDQVERMERSKVF